MNLNYSETRFGQVALVVGFIVPIENTSWLSLIVMVSKMNKICHVDFRKLNAATKKTYIPYHL
jgi:hypothetical protein